MRLIVALAVVTMIFGSTQDAQDENQFDNVHRLSIALKAFNYPGNMKESITVWREGGGKGTSMTLDDKTVDLQSALNYWADNCKNHDLNNVFVLSSDRRSIRIIDVENPKEQKMSSLELKRGDLVVVLKPIAEK